LAGAWPASRTALFGRLGLPDAQTASSLTASRLDHRDDQLGPTQRRGVAASLRWAAEALGYEP